jgi:hypothetical protein
MVFIRDKICPITSIDEVHISNAISLISGTSIALYPKSYHAEFGLFLFSSGDNQPELHSFYMQVTSPLFIFLQRLFIFLQ